MLNRVNRRVNAINPAALQKTHLCELFQQHYLCIFISAFKGFISNTDFNDNIIIIIAFVSRRNVVTSEAAPVTV